MVRQERACGCAFLYNDSDHVAHELTLIVFLPADALALNVKPHIKF